MFYGTVFCGPPSPSSSSPPTPTPPLPPPPSYATSSVLVKIT